MDIARSRTDVAAIAALGNQFTLGMAILIVGYLLFPLLAVLAVGLLLISLMLIAGHAIERRR